MTMFVGKAGVDTYRAIAIRSGLKLFVQTGLKPNRAWTPTAMLKAAGEITGAKYRRGQYQHAIAGLTEWIEKHGTTGGES